MRKEKKSRSMRGKRTHGYGSQKKHRGKGSKGGKGNAGLNKHKKTWVKRYEKDHFGKRGFKSLREKGVRKSIKAINLYELERIARSKGLKDIDVTQLGYDKVLGKGNLNTPLNISARAFSNKAKLKIENAKGSVALVS